MFLMSVVLSKQICVESLLDEAKSTHKILPRFGLCLANIYFATVIVFDWIRILNAQIFKAVFA